MRQAKLSMLFLVMAFLFTSLMADETTSTDYTGTLKKVDSSFVLVTESNESIKLPNGNSVKLDEFVNKEVVVSAKVKTVESISEDDEVTTTTVVVSVEKVTVVQSEVVEEE